MTWNHRLVKRAHDNEVFYAIHEVYYDEQGNPESITQDPVGVSEQSKGDVMTTLRLMERALTMPTLNYEDF
jgi:hypothetical protein